MNRGDRASWWKDCGRCRGLDELLESLLHSSELLLDAVHLLFTSYILATSL